LFLEFEAWENKQKKSEKGDRSKMKRAAKCKECGKPRPEVGVLIPYKGEYLCDFCVIENNKRIIAQLNEEEVAPVDEELEGATDMREVSDFEENEYYEDEEEGLMEWSPMTFLDEDSIDYVPGKSRRYKSGDIEQRNLHDEKIDPDAVALLPRAVAERFCLIPLRREGKDLVVAFSDPSDEEALREVRYFTGMDVNIVAADPEQIEAAISKYYENQEA